MVNARALSAREKRPAPFGDVAARALRRAESFVAELRVADAGGLDGNEQLGRDAVRDQAMVREREAEEGWVGRSCPPMAQVS